MSDAAEVLAAVFERLEASAAGRAMVWAVFGCHIREQLHCYNCSRDTHQSAYCQYLYNASAAGIRVQGVDMQHDFDGCPPLVSFIPHAKHACKETRRDLPNHHWNSSAAEGAQLQKSAENTLMLRRASLWPQDMRVPVILVSEPNA